MQNVSLIAVFRALNDASVKYLVVGGIAVISHGHMRLTQDLDLVIGFDEGNLLRGLQALVAVGYRSKLPVGLEDFCDEKIRESWIEKKKMLVFQMWSDAHRRLPVDILVSEPFDFEPAYENARTEWLREDLPVTVVDLERLMAMKRIAGRSKDRGDLEALERITQLRCSHG